MAAAETGSAVIAALQAANESLRRERDEGLAREAAIGEVLDLIGSGQVDLEPTLFTIAERAATLLGSTTGLLMIAGEISSRTYMGMLNLLSNAAKFTDGGTITLSATRDARLEGDRLRFTVADTGIGMTAEQQAKLFTAFTQAEAGTSAKYGGTGLGLALSREFCRLLGGDITVTSQARMGSTFIVALPAFRPSLPASLPILGERS